MIRKLLLMLLFFSSATSAQVPSLTVFVRENSSSGKPLVGVQITAPLISPAATDSTGKKTLLFPGRQVGDNLELSIHREGYELVNDYQRSVTLPRDPAFELYLFLCRPERCRNERLRHFGLAAEPLLQKNEADYQARLENLEKEGKASAEARARAEGERDQARATINRLIEELASLKPSEGSATNRRALQLFLNGQPEEALRELEQTKLSKAREVALAAKEVAVRELENLAQSYILRGQILASQMRFDEAGRAFEEATVTSPESAEASSELGFFLAQQNHVKTAVAENERGLELAIKHEKHLLAVSFFRILGDLYRSQGQFIEAEAAFAAGLETYTKIEKSSPGICACLAVEMLRSLGIVYAEQNRLDETEAAFNRALEKNNELTARDSNVYLSGQAIVLDSLGNLYSMQNRDDEARTAYEEAGRIARQLAAKNPTEYIPGLATTLGNIGTLSAKQGRFSDARSAFAEAAVLIHELAMVNPHRFFPNLARLLHNFGNLEMKSHNPGAAAAHFSDAVAIWKRFSILVPPGDRAATAQSAVNLTESYWMSGRRENAVIAAEDALSLIDSMDPAEQQTLQKVIPWLKSVVKSVNKGE